MSYKYELFLRQDVKTDPVTTCYALRGNELSILQGFVKLYNGDGKNFLIPNEMISYIQEHQGEEDVE